MHHQSDGTQVISDLAYDWITLIQNKAQAIRAYQSYIADARQANSPECAALFERILQEDTRQLQEAKQHLAKVLGGEMGGRQTEAGGR